MTMRILYLYDAKGWSIYNVGRLWLENQPGIDVDFVHYKEDWKAFEYDVVWFGFVHLFQRMSFKVYPDKTIVSIHDPGELRIVRKIVPLLQQVSTVTASIEMQRYLAEIGIVAMRIPTTGLVPLRPLDEIKPEPPSLLTVSSTHKRKNAEKLLRFMQHCHFVYGWSFTTKVGNRLFNDYDYIKFLDAHNIYMCMSFAEGGPIPAMEAMARGCIVFTTPVGQMPEIIQTGRNGYLLNLPTDPAAFPQEFYDAVNDVDVMSLTEFTEMRKAAIETIATERNRESIRQQVRDFCGAF